MTKVFTREITKIYPTQLNETVSELLKGEVPFTLKGNRIFVNTVRCDSRRYGSVAIADYDNINEAILAAYGLHVKNILSIPKACIKTSYSNAKEGVYFHSQRHYLNYVKTGHRAALRLPDGRNITRLFTLPKVHTPDMSFHAWRTAKYWRELAIALNDVPPKEIFDGWQLRRIYEGDLNGYDIDVGENSKDKE